MTDGQNLFDQPVKNDLRTYDNILNIETGQGDDYTTECLLDYPYKQIEANCYNSRTSDDINMKIGPVTKQEKQKKVKKYWW